jgi:GGDEF domain-containing protein
MIRMATMGDGALIRLANVLKDSLLESDLIARIERR